MSALACMAQSTTAHMRTFSVLLELVVLDVYMVLLMLLLPAGCCKLLALLLSLQLSAAKNCTHAYLECVA